MHTVKQGSGVSDVNPLQVIRRTSRDRRMVCVVSQLGGEHDREANYTNNTKKSLSDAAGIKPNKT